MPTGTVSLERGAHGHLLAHVDVFGLTPGSAHDVGIDGPGGGHMVRFPVLTATSAGQAETTLISADRIGWLPPLSRFVIRLGRYGDSGGSPLAGEPIAESGALPVHPDSDAVSALHAVTSGTDGAVLGRPSGRTTITFDAAAQTLTVGVTRVPGPGTWYLNLHQGGMNQILANGVPTLSFRPMLCTNITSFATAGGAPSAAPSPSPSAPSTAPATPTAPASSPAMTTMPSSTPSSSPSSLPAGPTGQPTHW